MQHAFVDYSNSLEFFMKMCCISLVWRNYTWIESRNISNTDQFNWIYL